MKLVTFDSVLLSLVVVVVTFSLWYRKTVLVFPWTIPPHLKVSARVCVRFEGLVYFCGPVVASASLTVGEARPIVQSQEVSVDTRALNVTSNHVAKVFATTVVILAELRNNCRQAEDDSVVEKMATNIVFVDFFHSFTDFTVESLVAWKAEAGVGADSVLAASLVCTRNGFARVTVWKTTPPFQ